MYGLTLTYVTRKAGVHYAVCETHMNFRPVQLDQLPKANNLQEHYFKVEGLK